MAAENIYLILVIVSCVALGQTETPLETVRTTEEHDVRVIRRTMQNLATIPGVRFVDYGPDGVEGYKYHLTSADNREYVIHTTGPIPAPIIESIKGTKENQDVNLLTRLISSTKIKSMESFERKDLTL
ncbi:AAEL000680-PA [Aedes aegypti]|uniref:AAEL000680-PA n=1 Tax=Aedes aegypti TaxID=7159 RepID=Q17NI0_AEDAE|nr:AAEL000680-PA [Aedes aegypti]